MNKAKKGVKCVFAILLALVLIIVGLPVTSISASAATTTGTTKVVLTLGDLLKYQDGIDWYTHIMYADGKMAYCVNPTLPAPSGTFTTTAKNCVELNSSNTNNYNLLVKTLYYCYGGDGFSTKLSSVGKTMKEYMNRLRSTYWLTASGSDLHYLLTHRVLAYFYGDSDWNYGLIQAWRDAVMDVVTALKNAPAVPNTTKLYLLDTGNSSYQKVILSKNLIKLHLQKNSANTTLTDGNSCYSLSGAIYNIYLDEACTEYFGYIRTDSSGFGKYGSGTYGVDVPLQTYYAKEVTAPPGYAIDNTVYQFKNSGKSIDGIPVYSFTCTDKPQNDPVNILLKKIDKNGQGLEGAEFTVSYYDGFYSTESDLLGLNPTSSWIFKTDEDGFINYDKTYLVSGGEFYYVNGYESLPLGTITIQETKAPDGYIIDDTLVIRQITSNNSGDEFVQTYNVPEISNEKNPGKIKIVKTSDDGIVAGIEFIVKNNDTGEEERLTTLSDGTITKDYYAGSYTITEVVDETKYFPQKPQTVTVIAGETATVKFHNKLTTEDFTICKTSTDGKVEGITFHIKDNVTGVTIDKVTDSKGYITVAGLTIGKSYTVTEEVPNGYEPQSPQTITIKRGERNFLSFANIRETGNLRIIKTASDGKLDGFAFTVRPVGSYEYLTPIQGLVTDKNGIIDDLRLQNIPTGDYIVTEVGQYWRCYEENPPQIVTVTKNETGTCTDVHFHNKLIEKPVKIVKSSPNGEVSGIKFLITGYFGSNPLKETREFITDADGVIEANLPASYWYDEYTIEEVVPEGYEPQPPQTFALDPDSDETTVLYFNNVTVPKIKIVKTSDDGIVEGIPFILSYVDADGYTVSDRKLTDSGGTILFEEIAGKSLKNGVEYTITEEVPDGYAEQPPQTVVAKSGEVATVSFHNSVIVDLQIVKTSEDGIIEGIWFALYANGSLVDRYQTNEFGEIIVGNLPAYRNGRLISYTVKELGILNDNGTYTIPERYNTPTMQSKTLQKNETTVFEFNNTLKRGNITLHKRGTVNPTTPVPDVVLNIYDSSGKLLLFSKDSDGNYIENDDGSPDIVTDFAGNAKIINLIYGDYTVREIKAGTGYHLLSEDVTVTLQSASTDKTIHNTEKSVLPPAGSFDKMLWLLIGGAVAIFGAILLIITIKKKRKDEPKMSKIKKYSKNFLSVFIVTLTLISMFCVGAVGAGAANPYHIDSSKTGSISFYKYEMNDISTATTPGDGTVKELPEGATPLEGVEFTAYQISDLDGLYTYIGKKLPTPTEAENLIENVSAAKTHTGVTDENGYIKLSNLPLGIYYVKETFSPSQVREKTASFVISVPTTSPDGTEWMYDLTVQPKNETKYADVTVLKTDNLSGAALGGFGFTLEEKIITKAKPNGVWTAVATNGSTGTTGGAAPVAATWTTGANGKFTISHLATDRAYRFKEISATDKQYIVDPTVYYEFTVNADGTVTYDSSNFKNTEPAADNTLEITNETVEVHKSVSTDKTNWMQDVTQDINKTVYWKVSADIPKVVAKLTTYTITDTLSKGLTYNSLEVKVEADGEAISKNDYTVTTSKGADGETVIVVDIKNKNTLAGHKVCDVILTTTLNESAVIGGDNPNTAKLTYTNYVASNSTFEKTTETPEVHTGGYAFKKINSEKEPMAGAEFSVYRSEADAKNGTNPIKFAKGKDGKYYMSTAANASATVISGSDGIVTILGLKYGANGLTSANGSTKYYVAETKAPQGYNLLKEPFEITVTATSHNYKDGINADVINTIKTVFPVTGSQAAMIFGVCGVIVFGLGTFVFFRKKNRKCTEK